MNNLDELFDGMPEPDAELDFVIDESKRLIAVPEEGVVLGVEGDKDVNRIRLRINRYYRGSDLADFAIRVNYENAEGDRNYFTVTEKTVTEQTITFIWVVAADAVAYKGAVHFAVSFYRVNDNGEILQKYNTTLGTVQNLVGLEVDVAQDDPVVVDFMAHLKNDITEHAAAYENAMNEAARSADVSAKSAKSSADNAKQSEETTKALLEKASAEYNGGCSRSWTAPVRACCCTPAAGPVPAPSTTVDALAALRSACRWTAGTRPKVKRLTAAQLLWRKPQVHACRWPG